MACDLACVRANVLLTIRCGHDDWKVPELFRQGGPLYGVLQPCGMGSAVEGPVVVGDVDALFNDRLRSNCFLASQVRVDEQVDELHKLVEKDAAQGWMSVPVPFEEVHPVDVRNVPGRGVAQLTAVDYFAAERPEVAQGEAP